MADKGQRKVQAKAPSMVENYARAVTGEEAQLKWKRNWLRGIQR